MTCLCFFLYLNEPWSVFVLCPLLKRSQLAMKTAEAINIARQVIRRQHKALSTEDTYIFWLRRYMIALREMPEGLSSEQKLERFLTDLARYRDVSASTQNQAFNSILPFYRDVLGQTGINAQT